ANCQKEYDGELYSVFSEEMMAGCDFFWNPCLTRSRNVWCLTSLSRSRFVFKLFRHVVFEKNPRQLPSTLNYISPNFLRLKLMKIYKKQNQGLSTCEERGGVPK
ncbi:MAG TPA: hypothetical protein VFH08_06015, partial [Chitinophagaceae bacterium]|nr:hypothetical protein [Chitinophagaceae bacterium]